MDVIIEGTIKHTFLVFFPFFLLLLLIVTSFTSLSTCSFDPGAFYLLSAPSQDLKSCENMMAEKEETLHK